MQMDTRQELIDILKKHNISRPTVALMLDVSIYTINSWLAPKTSLRNRTISTKLIEKLKKKVGK